MDLVKLLITSLVKNEDKIIPAEIKTTGNFNLVLRNDVLKLTSPIIHKMRVANVIGKKFTLIEKFKKSMHSRIIGSKKKRIIFGINSGLDKHPDNEISLKTSLCYYLVDKVQYEEFQICYY